MIWTEKSPEMSSTSKMNDPPDIGRLLREARERKHVTASQAAADLYMKVQHVEAMERNDFNYMAAPVYVKGFLRVYAEYLGLDPKPLIREYLASYAPAPPPLMPGDRKERSGLSFVTTLRKQLLRTWEWCRLRVGGWRKPLGRALGLIVLLVLAVGLLRGCARKVPREMELPEKAVAQTIEIPPPELPLLKEPPDIYLETEGPGQKERAGSGFAP